MTTRYMIVEELGEGAMGTVYRAVQVDLKREVALKVLHQEVQSSLNGLHRFKREVEACAALNHPHIIRILDCDEMADGCFYYTMDLIRGLDLASLAAREAPVPADRVVALMAQAADAVAHLHDRSMLHRDIKPRNVMVDDAGRLTLMDFGLVKLHERTVLTVTGQRVGMPKYMAPELFRGEPDAPARDVYGLGLTFWELLAGRLAFPERDMQKLVTIILGRGVEPISGVRSDLPAWLVDLVTRCVAIDPRQRPTALQVKESCLGRRPVTQAPVAGAPRRSTRGAGAAPAAAVVAAPRRPRRWAGMLTLVVACPVVAVALWSIHRSGPAEPPRSTPTTSAAPELRPSRSANDSALASPRSDEDAALTRARTTQLEGSLQQLFRRRENRESRFRTVLELIGDPLSADPPEAARLAQQLLDEALADRTVLQQLSQRLSTAALADPAHLEALVLAERTRACHFLVWQRTDYLRHLIPGIAAIRKRQGDSWVSLTELARQLDRIDHDPEGVQLVAAWTASTLAALRQAAGAEGGPGAALLPVFVDIGAVSHCLSFLQWRSAAKEPLARVVGEFDSSLEGLPGPAGRLLGKLARAVWEGKDRRRRRAGGQSLLEQALSLTASLRRLGPSSELLAGQLETWLGRQVEELARGAGRPRPAASASGDRGPGPAGK